MKGRSAVRLAAFHVHPWRRFAATTAAGRAGDFPDEAGEQHPWRLVEQPDLRDDARPDHAGRVDPFVVAAGRQRRGVRLARLAQHVGAGELADATAPGRLAEVLGIADLAELTGDQSMTT